ncbi:hypothetical protein EVAR_81927_1 [Eumeta japonica]|uniref:Uncharacterized protein n=1 Tax=Eumeta variegata TaxID=151549 RepID=A0A4C1UYD9_EUMVA|nr:hypothetical protein EVAR_81927_1 [Eumeta japonica]
MRQLASHGLPARRGFSRRAATIGRRAPRRRQISLRHAAGALKLENSHSLPRYCNVRPVGSEPSDSWYVSLLSVFATRHPNCQQIFIPLVSTQGMPDSRTLFRYVFDNGKEQHINRSRSARHDSARPHSRFAYSRSLRRTRPQHDREQLAEFGNSMRPEQDMIPLRLFLRTLVGAGWHVP